MIVTRFAREVKRLRLDRGLTIRDLAAKLGKSVGYLGKIEVQGEIPTPEFTIELARALEIEPAVLLRLAKEARLSSVAADIRREYTAALSAHPDIALESASGGEKMATVASMINMKGGVGSQAHENCVLIDARSSLAKKVLCSNQANRGQANAISSDERRSSEASTVSPQQAPTHSKGL